MVTASHNENGWTGVKMGIQKRTNSCARRNERIKRYNSKSSKFIKGRGNEKKIENFQKILFGRFNTKK